MIALYLVLAVFLLLLNAFFVLAEFAAVKMRATRVDELVQAGDSRARVFRHVQAHLDEYLSVCQVGITFASIGLGFVAEPSLARLVEPMVAWAGAATPAVAHSIAVAVAYLLVVFLHVLLGELVPKSMALRATERSALLTARPLKFFRFLFYVPLVTLNGSANLILRIMGLPPRAPEDVHSRQELKIILARSQSSGLMSLRRLLFIENIFDLEGVKVRHAMRPRRDAKVLQRAAPWPENERLIRETRFSRYPLVDEATSLPLGIVHVKDLYYGGATVPDLGKLARAYVTVGPDDDLDQLLAGFQRKRAHLAIVVEASGQWVGLITLEDVLEEITGAIEDEFEVEPSWSVVDALSASRVVLGVSASSMEEAIRRIMASVPAGELPGPADQVTRLLLERERVMSTYLGAGLALPHARLDGLIQPVVVFGRSEDGVPVGDAQDRARLFFVLFTPAQVPRSQVRLLASIANLVDSEFVRQKLLDAPSPQHLLEVIREAETTTSP